MARLLLINNGRVQEVQMGQELTIGRAYSNLLRLEGEEISRVHAIIYRRAEDYIVRDLDSKNGVLLNGQKVMNSVIVPGDDVQVGNYFIVFEPDGQFDLASFLRERNLVMPSSPTVPVARDAETSADSGESSVDPIDLSSETIYFTPAALDQFADPKAGVITERFYQDLLKLHLELGKPQDLSDIDEENRLYQQFLNVAVTLLGADRGVIVLRDEAGEVLRLAAIFPGNQDVAVNRVVLRAVLREQQVMLCNDVQRNPHFEATDTVRRDKIGSLAAYPLVYDKRCTGLIYVDAVSRDHAFRTEQLVLLHFLARVLVLCGHRVQPGR